MLWFCLGSYLRCFCEITGLNGKVSGPTITQYDENFNSGKSKFSLLLRIMKIWLGILPPRKNIRCRNGTAYTVDYTFENPTDYPMVAQAIPSVSPEKVHNIFIKLNASVLRNNFYNLEKS